jgi:hypothetical protein
MPLSDDRPAEEEKADMAPPTAEGPISEEPIPEVPPAQAGVDFLNDC